MYGSYIFILILWLIAEIQCFYEDGQVDSRPIKKIRGKKKEKGQRQQGPKNREPVPETDYYKIRRNREGWDEVQRAAHSAAKQ